MSKFWFEQYHHVGYCDALLKHNRFWHRQTLLGPPTHDLVSWSLPSNTQDWSNVLISVGGDELLRYEGSYWNDRFALGIEISQDC